MISHKYKCIFFHVPKCGGTSVRDALTSPLDAHAAHSHCKLSNFNTPEFGEYFKYAFVRNPWDRFLSAFCYLKAGGARTHFIQNDGAGADWDDNAIKKLKLHKNPTFSEFMKDKEFLKDHLGGQHFSPISNYLDYDKTTKEWLDLDFVGRFENFQEDFALLCSKIGVKGVQLDHLNKTKQGSVRKHYTSYYNKENADFVGEFYSTDIQRFNYEFS